MLYSSRAGTNHHWLGLMAVCSAVMLGSISSNAVADATNLYFSGTCTDCTGTGNLALTDPDLTDGVQLGSTASVAYSSNLLGNLVGAPNTGQIVDGIVDTTALPGAQFMEIQFDAVGASGQDQIFAFVSCGNSPLAGQSGTLVCGTAAQVASGQAFLAYGDWQIGEGVFSGSSSLPGGVGNKVQDYGTNGVWSLTAPPTVITAPEIDAASAVGALILLLGSLAVMRGRRTLPCVADDSCAHLSSASQAT
jgi:hypothetical protein